MRKGLLLTLTLLLTIMGSVFAQERTITGTISSADDGSPLPGVNILVSGTTNVGTVSDVNGKYTLKVPSGYEALEFSYIGMTSQKVMIGPSNLIDVALASSASMLQEVVVTALGIQKQVKALGFSQQQVGSQDLSAARESNLNSFLTGKVAGVQVSKTSSGTGGSSSITIRGAKSLKGNNQPLYVVDGVPITNEGHNSGGDWNDLDYGDGIGDINPEDVESMSVLKGPNASALYGARGSNGVILITTKSGQKKKGIGVEFNSNTSFETLNLVPTLQNKYATGYEETNIYPDYSLEIPAGSGKFYENVPSWHGDSWGPPMDGRRTVIDPFVFPEDKDKKLLTLLPQPEDNVRDFYQTGINTSNTLAISGSSEKTTLRLSVGNNTSRGIIPNEKLNKQTIMFSGNTQVTNYLSFQGKINYIHDEGNNRPILGVQYGGGNVANVLAVMGRYVPLSFLKEYYEKTGQPGNWPAVQYNPYYIVNELKSHDTKDRIIGQISANLKIAPWLNLVGRAGTDFYSQKTVRTWPVGSLGGDNSLGRIYNTLTNVKDINADVMLTANKELSSHFTINGTIGSSILHHEVSLQSIDGRNFKISGVYDVSNVKDIRPDTELARKEMQSIYFTGQVVYNNYLFFDVTGRNDWSSALGINDYSFFYPSVSTSFVFSDAFHLNQGNILSFGKVRASWAQVGNDSDPYKTKSGYGSTTTTYAGQSLSWMSSSIPLFNLKNELTQSWEIGTDLRFLNNRIGLDFTYYNGKTTNQILDIGLSYASGYVQKTINAGEIRNKGIEIALNLTPVKATSGFTWDINANYSKNNSTVVSLAPGVETLLLNGGAAGNTIEARPGQPYGNIVGYAYQRAPDGQLLVVDGKYQQAASQTVLGNITPSWIGGLNNTFSFKGISLNVLLDFVQGNELTSDTKYNMEAKGTGKWTTKGRREHDIVTAAEATPDLPAGSQFPLVGVLPGVMMEKDGAGNPTGNYVPNTIAVNGQDYWANRAWGQIGEEFVINGSYISLREVMLSYSFSKSFLDKTPFVGITISALGRNLMYLEEHMQGMGVSPESAPNTSASYAGVEHYAIPTTRTWGFNLKLTF